MKSPMEPPDKPTKNAVSYADAVRRPKSQPQSPWSTGTTNAGAAAWGPGKDCKWDQSTDKKKKSSKADHKKGPKGNWRAPEEPGTESTKWAEPTKPTTSTTWDPTPIQDAKQPPKGTFSYAEALKRKAFTPVPQSEDKRVKPKQDPKPTLAPLIEVALPKVQPKRAKGRQAKASASTAENGNKLGHDVRTFQDAGQGSAEETQLPNTGDLDRKQSAVTTRRNPEQKLENVADVKQPGISIRYDQTRALCGKEAIRFNAPAGSNLNLKNDHGLQHGARQGPVHATIYRPPPPAFSTHPQLDSTTRLNTTPKNSVYSGKKSSTNMYRTTLTSAWLPSQYCYGTPASRLPQPIAMIPSSMPHGCLAYHARRNALAHPSHTANTSSRAFPSPSLSSATTLVPPDDTTSEFSSEPTAVNQPRASQMIDRRRALIDLHYRGDISLWVNQYEWDVSIDCQGYSWKVHRDIICRDSDWFKEKLAASGTDDDRSASLDCSEVNPMQFANALHYIYQDAPHKKQMRMNSPLDGEPLAHAVFNYICGAAVAHQPMQDEAINALYDAALQLHVFFHQTPIYVLRHLSLSTLYKPLALALTIVFEQGPRKNMHPLRVVMAHLCDVSLMWMALNEGFQREMEKEWMPELMLNVVRDSIWFGGSEGVLADLFNEMQLAANERLERRNGSGRGDETENEDDFVIWEDMNDSANSNTNVSAGVDTNESTSGGDLRRAIVDGEVPEPDDQSEDAQPPQIIRRDDLAEAGDYELWRDAIDARRHGVTRSGPWRVPRSIVDRGRDPGGTYLDTHLPGLITTYPPTDVETFDPARHRRRASTGDDASQLDEDDPEPGDQTTIFVDDVQGPGWDPPSLLEIHEGYRHFR